MLAKMMQCDGQVVPRLPAVGCAIEHQAVIRHRRPRRRSRMARCFLETAALVQEMGEPRQRFGAARPESMRVEIGGDDLVVARTGTLAERADHQFRYVDLLVPAAALASPSACLHPVP